MSRVGVGGDVGERGEGGRGTVEGDRFGGTVNLSGGSRECERVEDTGVRFTMDLFAYWLFLTMIEQTQLTQQYS